ncbi:MAG: endonuclease domain-containing protein [Nanoarchaeota archaeon]
MKRKYERMKSDPKKWEIYSKMGTARRFKSKFKFPKDFDYYAVFESLNKNNTCHICQRNTRLFLEHCHKTKRIRGLLCVKCNTAIAFLNDDENLLRRAIDYLKK